MKSVGKDRFMAENTDNGLVAPTIAEFLAQKLKPREHLLKPWLPEQGLCMVHANRGVGKTHFGLGVAYAVATGGSFLKWPASKPTKVLYIDGEMPAVAMQERLARLVSSSDLEPTDDYFRLLTPDLQPQGMPNLASPADQVALVPLLESVQLLVLDNISTLVRTSHGENDDQSWILIQQWLLSQRAAGRSVLLIHHEGKGGLQRGTSKREDVLDTVIRLKRPSDCDPAEGACFEVSFTKSRGFFGEDAKPFEAKLNPDGLWQCTDLEDATFDRVLVLFKTEGLSQADIARELEVHRSTVSRCIRRAKSEGLL